MNDRFELIGSAGADPIPVVPGAPRLVGRLATCDVPVYDGSISRDHASLSVVADGVAVKDLGSTNGTFLNGTRLTGEGIAREGDTITFGAVSLRVRRATSQPPPVVAEALESKILRRVPLRPATSSPISSVIRGGTGGELGSSASSLLGLVTSLPDQRHAAKLEVLLEISKELSRQRDLDALLRRIAELLFKVAPVDLVCLMTVEGETLELVPRIVRDRRGSPVDPKAVPRALAYQAVAERVAILSENLAKDERFDSESVRVVRQRSALCVPLAGDGDEVLGILYAEKIGFEGPLGEDDLDLVSAVAGLAAVAIENRRLQERGQREEAALADLRRLLSPNDASEIVAKSNTAALAAAKRRVVVWMTEVVGLAAAVDRLTAQQVAELVNAYCAKVAETVFQYGGTLDHVVGHRVIALWGSPIARPDDADRALRAAQQVPRAIAEVNELWARRGRQDRLEVGVGIALGEAFVGSVGTRQRSEYTVIGRVVDAASALVRAAGPGEILVNEAFAEAARVDRGERARAEGVDRAYRVPVG